MKKIKFFLLSIFSVFLIIACSSESDENQSQVADFDRSSILKNYAENIIIPKYDNFKADVDALKTVVDEFASNPNSANFDKVHNKWFNAYKIWQHVEMFNIGKAEEIMFFQKMNAYPANNNRIESNVSSQKTDLTNPNDWTSQGFPAIDYMLHGIEDNKEKIIQKYVDDVNYGKYLKNLLFIMTTNTDDIVQDWPTSDQKLVSSE